MKKITLFSVNKELCECWEGEFSDVDVFKGLEFTIVNCSLSELAPHDAIVTAGNSYGIMNGGIDLAAREMFGIEIQDTIQWGIVQHYGGFLPVGQCITVPIQHEKCKDIIYAPTMATPRPIPPGDIGAVFSAILKSIAPYDSVAVCGLGTGAGGVSPVACAREMRDVVQWLTQTQVERET